MISLLVLFSFLFLAVSDYRQSLQFQNLNEEKQNIQLEVCAITMWGCVFSPLLFFVFLVICLFLQVIRGGRRIEISIFEIVVGDVVPLKIGDQVSKHFLLLS